MMRTINLLSRGISNLAGWMTHGVLHVLGLRSANRAHSANFSIQELKEIVSGPEIDGAIQSPERQMLSAVIGFGELVVRQVMVPRTEIIAVQASTTVNDTLKVAASHGVTKIPIYEDNLDQITGILYIKDLLPLLVNNECNDQPARELAREALFVPETVSVNDLLVHMRARRQHMFITLDEFGGTAGLVTLEDLLEEIVGDVRDPFDIDPPAIQLLPDGSAIIDGMTMIEEVNQALNLKLVDPYYDSIAGYVLGRLGRIAQVGDVIEDREEGISLRVESMERLRIARLHLKRL